MPAARPEPSGGAPWLVTLRWYLPLALAANLAWEAAQLPLYTLWREGSAGEIAAAVLHCTLGDGLIVGPPDLVTLEEGRQVRVLLLGSDVSSSSPL